MVLSGRMPKKLWIIIFDLIKGAPARTQCVSCHISQITGDPRCWVPNGIQRSGLRRILALVPKNISWAHSVAPAEFVESWLRRLPTLVWLISEKVRRTYRFSISEPFWVQRFSRSRRGFRKNASCLGGFLLHWWPCIALDMMWLVKAGR